MTDIVHRDFQVAVVLSSGANYSYQLTLIWPLAKISKAAQKRQVNEGKTQIEFHGRVETMRHRSNT